MELIYSLLSIVSGILVCIPLVVKICAMVKTNAKNKNWNLLITGILKYMSAAETMFETGAERKKYIMTDIVYKVARDVNYELTAEDLAKIDAMIDSLCDMANIVGSKVPELVAGVKPAKAK